MYPALHRWCVLLRWLAFAASPSFWLCGGWPMLVAARYPVAP
jgi:hypothetical protein